ncbi:MAG: hypothetical protein ACXWPM_03055 [Bdellovibrionota bacterium]
MSMRTVMGLILISLFSPGPSSATELPAAAEVTLTHGDGRVGSYVSSWNGFRTTSYWIEEKAA